MAHTSHTQGSNATPRMIGSEIYRHSHYGDWHPLRVPRVSTVLDLTRSLGWLPRTQYINSPMAKPAALVGFHTADYIAALVAAERDQKVSDATRTRHALGTHSNPVFAEMYRRPATSAGSALLAGELLRDGGVIYAPGCGTHHAMPDRANGFCYLNDPVLAIQSLRRGGAARVAYVDIDAHHPDGVETAFAHDSATLLISTHEENRWPRTGGINDVGVGNMINVPMPSGCHDDDMALVRDAVILPALAAFRPDAIVLQCGADAVTEDPQSRMALSNGALWDVVAALRGMAPRYLVMGGGGYNPWSVGRAWAGVWATLNGHDVPDDLPPAAQDILGGLVWTDRTRHRRPQPHWITTLRDAPRLGPVDADLRARVAVLRARLGA